MVLQHNLVFIGQASITFCNSRTNGWSIETRRLYGMAPTTENTYVVMGALSGDEIVGMAILDPKRASHYDNTVHRNYLNSFVNNVMDDLDRKGCHGYYLCIDRQLLDFAGDIKTEIERRRYNFIQLPLSTGISNPTELLWMEVKEIVNNWDPINRCTLWEVIPEICVETTARELQEWIRLTYSHLFQQSQSD